MSDDPVADLTVRVEALEAQLAALESRFDAVAGESAEALDLAESAAAEAERVATISHELNPNAGFVEPPRNPPVMLIEDAEA